jgi:protein-S-isoprenylcysteine O-methyltransferase Ste14
MAVLPLVYTNSGAAAVFMVACLVWLVPEMIGMAPQMAKVSRKTVIVQDRGSMIILIGLQWAGLALNFGLAWLWPAAAIVLGGPPGQPAALFVVGVAFIILGVALRWYAIHTLGSFFTRDVAVSRDQQVVQSGPYRLIRHPAYSGTFLTMLGVGLAIANWASLGALLLCVFAGHFYRVLIEEKALIQTIGQPYVEYMRRTRRFIPLLF